MATTTAELRKLEREVEELRKRVAWLEQENGERKAGASAQTASRDLSENSARLSERERARRILRRAGITRELTAEEKQLAAAWHALPEREKSEVIETLNHLHLEKPLSQLIHEMRG